MPGVVGGAGSGERGRFFGPDAVGVDGRGWQVADGLNEVIVANEALGVELARVARVVGRQGELSSRWCWVVGRSVGRRCRVG